jgi:hypothetical protein
VVKTAFAVVLTTALLACSGDDPTDNPTTGAGGAATGGMGTTTATGAGGTTTSSGSGGGTAGAGGVPEGCYDYAAFTPFTVSFSADVMPIFAARCAQCHDDPNESIYYGSDAAVVYAKHLDGTPKQAPHLKFVAPNDPVVSYMLAKVEYDDPGGTCSLVQCSEPGCDLFAPPNDPLPEDELAILRSWVMTGAAND